jgi:hypothetical protein
MSNELESDGAMVATLGLSESIVRCHRQRPGAGAGSSGRRVRDPRRRGLRPPGPTDSQRCVHRRQVGPGPVDALPAVARATGPRRPTPSTRREADAAATLEAKQTASAVDAHSVSGRHIKASLAAGSAAATGPSRAQISP